MPPPIESPQRPSTPSETDHRGRSVGAAVRALVLAVVLLGLAAGLALSAFSAAQRGLDASTAVQTAAGAAGAIVAFRASLWSLVAALVSAADGTSRCAQRAEAALRERAPLLARRLLIGAAGASLVLAPLPASAVAWSSDGTASGAAAAEAAAAGAPGSEAAASAASAAQLLAWPSQAAPTTSATESAPSLTPTQTTARTPRPARTAAPAAARTETAPRASGTRVTVHAGDTLWGLAAAALPHASQADLVAAWPELHEHNRKAIGSNPHLLMPGTRIEIPAATDDGRTFNTSDTTRPEHR
ncbi:LysM peptidoglycan-binding domain-containing protein [Sanguibacter sp. A247]|uniref:LysM peptidoglycan-binding domain-containing protein n=1 Tax=unclassified Sanguibacter TaxID=2645534 RepID=UPI003FD6F0CF